MEYQIDTISKRMGKKMEAYITNFRRAVEEADKKRAEHTVEFERKFHQIKTCRMKEVHAYEKEHGVAAMIEAVILGLFDGWPEHYPKH
jgi:hypothetical protein